MAVKNLTLYDVIVDLIPGVVALVLAVGLIGAADVSLTTGFTLLVLAYVVGRLLHAAGSMESVVSVRWDLEPALLGEYFEARKHGISFRYRLQTFLREVPPGAAAPDDLTDAEVKIHEDVVEALAARFEVDVACTPDASNFDGKREETGEDDTSRFRTGVPDDVRHLRYLGENYLYGRETLYRKYEMLSTFYRSLWLVSTVGAVAYAASAIAPSAPAGPVPDQRRFTVLLAALVVLSAIAVGWWARADVGSQEVRAYVTAVLGTALLGAVAAVASAIGPFSSVQLGLTAGGLGAVSGLALRQRVKYAYKKHRAFVNDLSLTLSNEE